MATGVVIFVSAVLAASSAAAERGLPTAALTDFAFMLISSVAAVTCFWTARLLSRREREAWLLFGLANGMWFGGQLIWSYFQLVVGATPALPHWVQSFFFLHPLLMVAGLMRLPKSVETHGLTPRHIGNVVMIGCATVVAFIVTLWEPAMLPHRSWTANAVALLTCSALAVTCMTAVYLLWSYRWNRSYWPLVLVVMAVTILTITYATNLHYRMASTNNSYGGHSAGWLLGFGVMACAAYERIWQIDHPHVDSIKDLEARERLVEAIVPALLILLMLVVTWLNSTWLTQRVAGAAIVFAALFALALTARDLWIQKEEQKLVDALNRSNDGLIRANRELVEGERRYLALNADLERRVAVRTTELQSAYRELEGFSYAVAHDIKAPLRAINSFGALLTQEYTDRLDDRALNYVQRMSTGALHVARLVDDLLAYSHIERSELRLQPVDLPSLIESCLEEQRDEIGRLGAQIAADVEPLSVTLDAAAMLQTLRNLLQNALKFSAQATPPRISIEAHREAGNVLIAVTDNGIGFDMQYHEQIFALFQRLHGSDRYSGTGIGLAIARKAVERMGGRMWAQSKPGEGARFYIELPTPERVVSAASVRDLSLRES
jgi:signal transduction histidine kinase